jgi:hypothetical protein
VHTGWGKTLAPLQAVKTNYSYLTSVVQSIKLAGNPGMPIASGTDPSTGLEEAIKVFDDPNYVSKGAAKVIVLVSDGEPNVSSNGAHPTMTNDQLLALAQQRADEAWAQNIHVYVVFFNRTNDATAADRVRSMARGKGDFVQVTDAEDLPAALRAITKKLPMQLVK